jgi:hypothetical protein
MWTQKAMREKQAGVPSEETRGDPSSCSRGSVVHSLVSATERDHLLMACLVLTYEQRGERRPALLALAPVQKELLRLKQLYSYASV